jgi:osmotically-inducible protein OsmY
MGDQINCLWRFSVRKEYLLCFVLATGGYSAAYAASSTHGSNVTSQATDSSVSLVMPASRPVADDALVQQVNDEISGIVASGAASVMVIANEGSVTLEGVAGSDQVARQLMDTARAVFGVKEVKSELKVMAS